MTKEELEKLYFDYLEKTNEFYSDLFNRSRNIIIKHSERNSDIDHKLYLLDKSIRDMQSYSKPGSKKFNNAYNTFIELEKELS